jgi:hypothetical protein
MKNAFLPLNLQFFAAEEEAPPANPTVEEPENKPDDKPADPPKTFTQAELDDLIEKRIARERKKFEGFDDLKKKAEEFERQLEEKKLAELSEKDRAEELRKKAEEQAKQYASQLDQLQAQIRGERINNEFIKAATALNVAYVDDALKLADLSAVEFDEQGNPVGVDAIVKALVDNKPFLVASQQKPRPIGESTNSPSEALDKTSDQLLKEAADKAKRTGKTEDMIAYATLKAKLGR